MAGLPFLVFVQTTKTCLKVNPYDFIRSSALSNIGHVDHISKTLSSQVIYLIGSILNYGIVKVGYGGLFLTPPYSHGGSI